MGMFKYFGLLGNYADRQNEIGKRKQEELAEYEKANIDAQKELEAEQLSREQTTARKVHAKRMGTLRSQLAQTGSILDVGTADMLQDEETEAQVQQESVAMGDWFDRQRTLEEAKEMVDYKTDLAVSGMDNALMSNAINFAGAAALTAATGGAAAGSLVAPTTALMNPSASQSVSVPIGQRRAGYKQWLAGGL